MTFCQAYIILNFLYLSSSLFLHGFALPSVFLEKAYGRDKAKKTSRLSVKFSLQDAVSERLDASLMGGMLDAHVL
jgi:hypothetical protein